MPGALYMKRTEATVETKNKKILKKVVPHVLAVAKRIQMKVDLNSMNLAAIRAISLQQMF